MTYALEVQLLLKCAKEHRESKVRKSLNIGTMTRKI